MPRPNDEEKSSLMFGKNVLPCSEFHSDCGRPQLTVQHLISLCRSQVRFEASGRSAVRRQDTWFTESESAWMMLQGFADFGIQADSQMSLA